LETPVTKADDYRAKAAECNKLADDADDATAKHLFREAAGNWRTMADQAERPLSWPRAHLGTHKKP
jgi:hypothetical protein